MKLPSCLDLCGRHHLPRLLVKYEAVYKILSIFHFQTRSDNEALMSGSRPFPTSESYFSAYLLHCPNGWCTASAAGTFTGGIFPPAPIHPKSLVQDCIFICITVLPCSCVRKCICGHVNIGSRCVLGTQGHIVRSVSTVHPL